MKHKVTQKWLKEKKACRDGFNWWVDNCEGLSNKEQLLRLVHHRADWANWLIVRMMNRKQKISYAIFAAEQVIDIYERKNPNDNRPREAINAAKAVLKRDNVKNRKTADAAADAADDAAADTADDAAADAAYAAAAAAAYAAYAAYTDAATYAADAYTADARTEMQITIINHGIKILNLR